MSIQDNLQKINLSMQAAASRSGRSFAELVLVAVSKTKPAADVVSAIRAGQLHFGENYVQEALQKISQVEYLAPQGVLPDVRWHFVGSLQTNKVKNTVGLFELIHSVDRLKLAEEISKQAQRIELQQKVLLQVHVGEEASKGGFSTTELEAALPVLKKLSGLQICGLMSLPPLGDESQSREYFRELNNLFLKFKKQYFSGDSAFCQLSMGTTQDYVWAIEEGATMIRVGTAIFGERNDL